MNIYKDKLEVGMEFRNYKELAIWLGEPVKRGNSKNSQLKTWDMYFSRSVVEGKYKITISDVFTTPLAKDDNRKGGNNAVKYLYLIEGLILDLLIRSDEEKIFLSKNNMLKALKMVSDNYTYGKRYPNRASTELDVKREELNDFYQTSDSLLLRNLTTAIESLVDQSLISCDMIKTVGLIETKIEKNENDYIKGFKGETEDKYGDIIDEYSFVDVKEIRHHRKASEEEVNAIRNFERDALLMLNVNSKSKLYSEGKVYEFYKYVTDRLFESFGVYVYYNSYQISFSSKYVIDAKKKHEMLMGSNPRSIAQTQLNGDIVNRLSKNAVNRSENAVEKYKVSGKDIHKLRTEDAYTENHLMLINNFIAIAKGEVDAIVYEE